MRELARLNSVRENFLKMKGGKLISLEAFILGFLSFTFFLVAASGTSGKSLGMSVVVAAVLAAILAGFAFPILIGLYQPVAWVAAVVFSLLWGILAFALIGAFDVLPSILRLIISVVCFAISLRVHKNYSGLQFQEIGMKSYAPQEPQGTQMPSFEPPHEEVRFCPKCGRRIRSTNGLCDVCDR